MAKRTKSDMLTTTELSAMLRSIADFERASGRTIDGANMELIANLFGSLREQNLSKVLGKIAGK